MLVTLQCPKRLLGRVRGVGPMSGRIDRQHTVSTGQ